MAILHLQPAVAHDVLAGALALGAAGLAGIRWGRALLGTVGTAGAVAAALALLLVAASSLPAPGDASLRPHPAPPGVRPVSACPPAPSHPLSPVGVGDPRSVFDRAWGPGQSAPGPRAAARAAARGTTGARAGAATRPAGAHPPVQVTYRAGRAGRVRVVFSGCPDVAREVAFSLAPGDAPVGAPGGKPGAAPGGGPGAVRSLLRRTLPPDSTVVVAPFRDAGGATVSLYQSPTLAAHLPSSRGYVTAAVTGASLFVSLGDIENLAPRVPFHMRAL